MNRLAPLRHLLRLRLEEFISLLFIIPSLLITLKANWYFIELGQPIPRKFYGGIVRLLITMIVMTAFFGFLRSRSLSKSLPWLRDLIPFLFCLTIYTNLHDTIHFVNPHDIHDRLIAIDQALFGVQPVLWAQQFYHPWLTWYFSISYMNYAIIAIIVVLCLLVRRRYSEMRKVLLGTILCFYFGYALYILFPAAPPRLALADQFVRDFGGGWLGAAQIKMVRITASSSRAAFPSLHCAITLISLIYASKVGRTLFYLLLLPGVSLVLSTVYLRHHYVIDILAGFALAIAAYVVAPRVASWWEKLQERYPIAL